MVLGGTHPFFLVPDLYDFIVIEVKVLLMSVILKVFSIVSCAVLYQSCHK